MEHELVSKLKELALELDRPPTKVEFTNRYKSFGPIEKLGGFKVLMQMAGMEPRTSGGKKAERITNEIFKVNIQSHLENHEPPLPSEIIVPKRTGPYPKIAILGDFHGPFQLQKVVDAFIEFVRLTQPEYVIQDGDLFDMYSWAKFPRSHNIFTPKQEEQMARAAAEDFWKRIQLAAPAAKCVQIMGNHDVRPLKRVLEALPQMEHWVEKYMRELYTFEGVETIHDAREEYFIQDIGIFHGHMSKLGAHMEHMLFKSVNGHTHRGGVVFKQIRGQILWELNVGYCGDPTAKGLTYTPQKIIHWTHGWGYIDALGPRFIPYQG